jgi:hypothetical protein
MPQEFSVLSAIAKFFSPFKLDNAQKDLSTVLGARFFLREQHKAGLFQKNLRDSQVVSLFDGSSEVNLYSLSTQLPALAKKQLKIYSDISLSNHVFDTDLINNLFSLNLALPTFVPAKLDIANHGNDTVMEYFPLVISRIKSLAVDSRLSEILEKLNALLMQKHKDNLALICAPGAQRVLQKSAKIFVLAKQYCIVYAGVCASLFWLTQSQRDNLFVARGHWLAICLQRLLLDLNIDVDIVPEEYIGSVSDELLFRTKSALTYQIEPIPLFNAGA